MAKAEDEDWLAPREYVKRIAGDPAAETEAEYFVEEQFRRGELPHCYRVSNGELRYNDLSEDFRREADVDFTAATATRPARTIYEDNPARPSVRDSRRPKQPQWFGNPLQRDSDPFMRPDYIPIEIPAETITELKFAIPRAPAVDPVVLASGAAAGQGDATATATAVVPAIGSAAGTGAAAAVAPALRPLEWLFAAVARRKKAGDIPTGRGAATLFAKQLADEMVEDVRAGKCSRAISWKSIRPRLYENKLWPLK